MKNTALYPLLALGLWLLGLSVPAQSQQIALLRYGGGGDWYANPSSLTNLIRFSNQELKTTLRSDYATVDIGSPEIFNYPWVHLTGHGNILLSENDAVNLRRYLEAGGFLHADDNYGLSPFFLTAMKRVFPDQEPVELGAQHPIFHQPYDFPQGLPKIHEHDNKRPQALGWFVDGRLVCVFTYECDLGDGWEDAEVHGDSAETRLKALKMGSNLLQFAFTQ